VGDAGDNWSREEAVRSLGFRRVPGPAPVVKASRDGAVRSEFVRGTGSFDACTGILDGRGMPLGLFGRVSSIFDSRLQLCCFGVLTLLAAQIAMQSTAQASRQNPRWQARRPERPSNCTAQRRSCIDQCDRARTSGRCQKGGSSKKLGANCGSASWPGSSGAVDLRDNERTGVRLSAFLSRRCGS
jgi:hypothetical protein